MKERLTQPDRKNGYLFDGFPRTIPQSESMKDAGVALDYVLEISVPDSKRVQQPMFMKNFAVMGGLLTLPAWRAGSWSLDGKSRR